jgi:hypothetical protein
MVDFINPCDIKMISIHYIIGQISPNLFKVDATTLQRATCDVK